MYRNIIIPLCACLLAISCSKEKLTFEKGGVRNSNGRGPIKGDFTINQDAEFFSDTDVILTINVENADEMRFSNDNKHWSSWEPLKNSKKWQLPKTAPPENDPEDSKDITPPSAPATLRTPEASTAPETKTSTTVYAEFGHKRYYYLKRRYKMYYFHKKDFLNKNSELYPYFGGSISMSANARQIVVGIANNREHYEQFRLHGVPLKKMYGVYSFYLKDGNWQTTSPMFPVNRKRNPSYKVKLSPDGSTLLVTERTDLHGSQAITVFVYRWLGSRWIKDTRFSGPVASFKEMFGNSISLSRNGNIIAVSAPARPLDDNPRHGAVYIFTWDGHHWTKGPLLTGEKNREYFSFGKSIALSADGLVLAISTIGYVGHEKMGCVYIYNNTKGTFTFREIVHLSNQQNRYNFGSDIALSQDGSVLAVGTPAINEKIHTGAVYIFRHDHGYKQLSVLTAPDKSLNGSFGKKIALSLYGKTIAVNAYPRTTVKTDIHGAAPGQIFLFKAENDSWKYSTNYKGLHTTNRDLFGRDFILSQEGSRILFNELYRHEGNTDLFGSGIVQLR